MTTYDDEYPVDPDHTFVWRLDQTPLGALEKNMRPWCEDHGVWVHKMRAGIDSDEGDLDEWLREHRDQMTANCERAQMGEPMSAARSRNMPTYPTQAGRGLHSTIPSVGRMKSPSP